MEFIESVKTCFVKYFDFSGRASRSEFWYFTLFLVLYVVIVSFFLGIYFGYNYPGLTEQQFDKMYDSMYIFIILPLVFPILAVTARRFHDFGHSGWIQLGFYIPMNILDKINTTESLALYTIILVSFYIYASQKPMGENRYDVSA
ncbi:MAG: DUF805 domain-containing protein [Pelagibacterales bacterium]|nr:DUF805 domain-containing protein [Pelagibacterales bacterium]